MAAILVHPELTERIARDVARYCAAGESVSLEELLREWAECLQASRTDAGMWQDRAARAGDQCLQALMRLGVAARVWRALMQCPGVDVTGEARRFLPELTAALAGSLAVPSADLDARAEQRQAR